MKQLPMSRRDKFQVGNRRSVTHIGLGQLHGDDSALVRVASGSTHGVIAHVMLPSLRPSEVPISKCFELR